MLHLFTYSHNLFIYLLRILLLSVLLVSYSQASTPGEPQQIMEKTAKQMLNAFIREEEAISKDPDIAFDLINTNLVPKINFPLMSRWVLGKNWKKASLIQRQQFIAEFKTLVVEFYTHALIQYLQGNNLSTDIITFKPFRGKKNSKYATVRSQVNPPNGANPIKVNYDLYRNKKGLWQVYDVTIEGISLVTTYRSSFKQIISQQGMDGLLKELKNKNSTLINPKKTSQLKS